MDHRISAAEQFKPQGQEIGIQSYGKGNVNDTFLVSPVDQPGPAFILQRLNSRVFRQPQRIIHNLRVFTDHVRQVLQDESIAPGHRWEVADLLLTRDGQDHWIDPQGAFWRALRFIDHSQTFDTIQNEEHAREVGWALATFHHLVCRLPIGKLTDTLEGFHITPGYLSHFEEVLTRTPPEKTPGVDYGLQFIRKRRPWAAVLEEAKEQGRLQLRTTHGDPKVNNVLFDVTTGQAIGMVDLDTLKPGLIQVDIGDCLRSCCNPLGEDTGDWEAIRFDQDLCRAILEGYLPQAREFLLASDYDYLFEALRLIAFELGLRFFTDYLEGNVYFKVDFHEQNLFRALGQFKLTESIESQAADIQALIREMR